MTPSSGSGAWTGNNGPAFAFLFRDNTSFANIAFAEMAFAPDAASVNQCRVRYQMASNTFLLMRDNGTWSDPLVPGGWNFASNNQCTLVGPVSIATGMGTDLTTAVVMSFNQGFQGAKTVFMQATNFGGIASGWQPKGTWTVAAPYNQAPVPVNVTPSSGTGNSAVFSFLLTDFNGAFDIAYTQVAFHSVFTTANSCYLHLDRIGTNIWLLNDPGSAWLGPISPGSGTIENTQCRISGTGSGASSSGNNLTYNVNVLLETSGTKNIYSVVGDRGGLGSSLATLGTRIVP